MAELSTLARPYAKAAFEYALEAGDLQGWSDSLGTASSVAKQSTVDQLLSSPSSTSAEQAAALTGICGESLTVPERISYVFFLKTADLSYFLRLLTNLKL